MNPHSDVLNRVLELGRDLPPEELPQFLGTLTHASALAMARLTPTLQPPKQADRLLNIAETATLLGCGKSILYHGRLGALTPRRVGRKIMYAESEVQKYISNRR